MNKVADNTHINSSIDKLNDEVCAIYGYLMEDLTSKSISLTLESCYSMPCLTVEEIFDKKVSYEIIFSSLWTKKTISKMNEGMSGLILDELGKENIFSNLVFEKYFSLLNQLMSKNNILKAVLSSKALEEINRKYGNKYKLIEVKEVFVDFVMNKDKNYVPNICLEIQVEREESCTKTGIN